MSNFPDRDNAALLVIDVQNDVVSDAWNRESVIANINTLVEKARDAGTAIIWVQHSDEGMAIGSPAWEIVPELHPLEIEPHIRKRYRSSFEETNLESVLAELGVEHLFISGAQSNNCVRHTTHAALERGYDVTLVEDAHTTSDSQWDSGILPASVIVDETNQNFLNYSLPGRMAIIDTTEKVIF
ncbi:MAG: cysteine hydrolase family protein [Actinomycetes bacterium]